MDYLENYKIQITYPSMVLYFNEKENLDIIKPNLRYILNDMKKDGRHNYCLVMFSKLRENTLEVEYSEEREEFQIGQAYFEKKECLDKIFEIIVDWMNKDKEGI